MAKSKYFTAADFAQPQTQGSGKTSKSKYFTAADFEKTQSSVKTSKSKYFSKEDFSTETHLINRINTLYDNSNTLITDYQNRFSDRKFNYEDAYVSDSASYLETVTQRSTELQKEYEDIIAYLDQNSGNFDQEWVNSVKKSLTDSNITGTYDQIVKAATEDNAYWNSFGGEDMVQQYGSAEKAYRDFQYTNKYQGKTSDEIQEAIDGLADGEEKEWLSANASGLYYDELLNLDTAAEEQELAALKADLADFSDLLNAFTHIADPSLGGLDAASADLLVTDKRAQQIIDEQAMHEGLSMDENVTSELTYQKAKENEITNRYAQYVIKHFGSDRLMDAYKGELNLESELRKKEERIEKAKEVQEKEKQRQYFNSLIPEGELEQLGQYVSTRTEVSVTSPKAYLGDQWNLVALFGDVTYDYINKNQDAVTTVNQNARGDGSEFLGYSKGFLLEMTDDERMRYNALYAKDKENGTDYANEYLDFLEGDLLGRKKEREAAEWANYAAEHPVLASGYSIAISPLKGLGYVGQALDLLYDGKLQENAGYNHFSYTQSAIRNQVSSMVENKWGGVGSFAYNTGMSMADFVFTTAVSGGNQTLSLAIMGSGAAADKTIEAKERGLADWQAFSLGTIAGIAEVAMEKISLNAWLDGDMSEGAFRYMWKNAFSEGIEETGTGLVNFVADTIIAADKSELRKAMQKYMDEGKSSEDAFCFALADQAEEIGLDALGGFLSGSAIGGGTYAGTSVVSKYRYGDIGKNQGQAQKLTAEGMELNPDSKYMQKMQAKVKEGKNLTGMQIRNILAANQEQITANDMQKIQKAAEKRLTDLGQTENVSQVAEIATKWATGQEITRAEKKLLTHSQYGSRVANELLPENIVSGGYSTEWAEDIGTESVNKAAYNKKAIRALLEEMANMEDSAAYKSLEERAGTESTFKVSKDGQTSIGGETVNLSKAEVVDFVKDKKGNIVDMTLKVDGKEVKASEINYADGDQSYLFEAVSKIENITPADATVIVRDYEPSSGQSVGEYLNGIDEGYTYGYYGYSEADLKAGNFAPKLTETQMKTAYELGKFARKNSVDANEATKKRMRTAAEAAISQKEKTKLQKARIESDDAEVYFQDGKSVVKFDEHSGKYDDKRMAAVNTAKFLSKLGIGGKYYFYESYMKDGVRVYKDSHGNEVEAPNGIYKEADGSIHIDLNAGNTGQGTALFTLGHELTHFVKDQSKKQFKILGDLVTAAFDKTDISMHERVLEKQKFLESKRREKVSYDEAFEEVVADAMSTMLSDGSFYDLIMEIRVKDKGLFATIKRFFKDMISKFKRVYEKLTPDQRDARDIREMKDVFDNIQKVFAEALVEASDNFQATQVQKNTTEDGGEKYSIERTQNMTWEEQVNGALYDGKNIRRNDTLIVAKPADTVVADVINDLPLAIPLSVLTKASNGKDISHSIKRGKLAKLNKGIKNAPMTIVNPDRNAVVFVTNIEQGGLPMVAAFDMNVTFDGDNVHKATSIHLQVDVQAMLHNLPESATVYIQKNELDPVGATNNLRGLAAKIKFVNTLSQDSQIVNSESAEALDVEVDAKFLDHNSGDHIANVRFSERETLEQAADSLAKIGDDDYLKAKEKHPFIIVMDNTPEIVLESMDGENKAANRRVIIRRDALYLAIREDGVQEGHYHGLGKEVLKKLPEYLERPDVILKTDGSSTKRIVLTSIPVKSGQAIISVEFESMKDFDGQYEYFNVIVTVFDLHKNYLKGLFKKHSAEIKYEKEDLVQVNPQLYEWLRIFNTKPSTDKVTQPTPEVNNQNSGIKSERGEDNSNRALLANAFEGISQNSVEYAKLQEYRENIKVLNLLEDQLAELNAQIREIRFTKGKYDAKKLQALEEKAERIAKDINKQDKVLLNMEASGPLRKVIEYERKKATQKIKEHIKEIQENKKARAEQTELRHKIRKAVRDLDKLLNRGNKKTNVKEDMKGFVSKALELADYLFTDHISNDDLIRKGINPNLMRENEPQLVKETEEILSQLYDNADSLTDEEFTKLDAKRKANEDKLKNLLTAQRNERLNTPVYNLFNDLVTEYASLNNSSQEAVKGAYDPKVEEFLRSYLGETNGETDSDRKTLLQNMRVADMTTEELWKLYNAYTIVLHSVRNANKLFVAGMAESLETMANNIVADFSKRKAPDGKASTVLRNLSNKIVWNYEKLYYALDRIGSEAFTELVMNIANSENTVMQDVIEAAAFRDKIVEQYGFNDWKVDKKIDREFLDNTGKKFKLTLGELMSLYAYSRRKGAWDHIEYGGFIFGKAALTDPKPADSYKLTREQCEAITNTLTKKQKGYVEEMQKFLSETMGEKGNEVSMLLYGIKMFGEKNYFPIHIAGQFKAQANESQAKAAAGFSAMTNAGFTHAQNPNAKAPFVLEGFNEIWADHVNEMSRYHGTVPALEDMRRVMNRSSYSEADSESVAIKQLMENNFGKEAVAYFDNLYREANSGAIVEKLEKWPKKLLSLFRKNSVAYSLSVLIQQPASLVRAYALIDKRYFGFKGFGTITSGVAKAVFSKWNKAYANAYSEMLKYAPGVTMAKEIGGFDTATGGSIRSYLLDTGKSFKQSVKTENIKGKGKAVLDLVDDNAIANLPNVADKIAWIEIWNACKRETVAKHKDLATSSDAFMQIVGERFTEVIRATQVYDSIFAKSPMLKSKYLAVQYLVSFMNEPNTVANMAEKAVRDVKNGNWKNGARTAAVVIHSIIFTNLLKSIIYAMRDDDEDETYIEKYIEAITSGLMDDFNALNYIPLLRDMWSLAQGYDVERADMAIVSDAIDAVVSVVKNARTDTSDMTEEQIIEFDKKCIEAKWKLADSLAIFFGIPVKNIRREINGVADCARIASANAGKTTKKSALDKILDSVIDSIPFMKVPTKTDKLYNAIVSGDDAYVERFKASYKDEDAYHSAVRKALRENDTRIREAAQAQISGDPSERVRIAKTIIADGFEQDDVVMAINSEINALTPDESSGTKKAKGFYTVEDFVLEFVNGDGAATEAVKTDIVQTAQKNGKTLEEAEKDFASNVQSNGKKAYLSGSLDDAQAERLLVEYAGKDEEEAKDKVVYWAFLKAHPEYAQYDLNEADVSAYREHAEPADIPMEVYVQFRDGTKGLEAIKDKWGDVEKSVRDQTLEVIRSLPLTRKQKDALYLAAGYSESKIWDVPW